ncbi:MAG: hypothetical protein Q9162_004090 [Coniocarpon cinnabarinum]
MTPDLWHAKKVVDATLHPDTGKQVLLPFRMSCFVLSNLVVTAGMLTPNMGTRGTLAWQFANQSLNVCINASNANKSSPLSYRDMGISYAMAVTASCGVAVGLNGLVPRLRVREGLRVVLGRLVPFVAVASAGALNCFLMRGGELREGIDVFPHFEARQNARDEGKAKSQKKAEAWSSNDSESVGRSKKAALIAVSETAASRVINATPVMAIPPLILITLQRRSKWLQARPRMVLPVNLGLIFATSVFALPLALAVFPQREFVSARKLETEIEEKVPSGMVWFNRGI